MPEHLGVDAEEYKELGKHYLGTERVPKSECELRVQRSFEVPIVDTVIGSLAAKDIKRAGVAHRYFENMGRVLAEACRVLMLERFAGIVVGPSNIKKVYVPTHQILAEMGAQTIITDPSTGNRYTFEVEDIHRRVIDDSKRQLPYLRGQHGPGMRDEFVIMLRKVTAR
jgi:hypothetical protein